MKKYCQDCGQPNDAIANFCLGCGFSFKKIIAKTNPAPVTANVKLEIDDEEQEIVPEVEGLDVEIIKPVQTRQTCADIFRDGVNNPSPISINRQKNTKTSKKSALEMLKKEGGAGGESINVGGES